MLTNQNPLLLVQFVIIYLIRNPEIRDLTFSDHFAAFSVTQVSKNNDLLHHFKLRYCKSFDTENMYLH